MRDMRIINLTPGTGSWHCGSCLRDSTLITALRKSGHDAIMVPMYLPLLTEGPAPTQGAPLFYGGVNVYLQQKSGIFRRTPRWLDQRLDSPALLRAAGRRSGMTSARDLGALTLSMLKGEEGNQIKELQRLTAWMVLDGKPDAICLSNALLIGLARHLKEIVGVPVVCTLQGEDTFLDSLTEPYKTDCWRTLRERAADVDAFLPVSHYHADVMAHRMQIDEHLLSVVYNGIDCEAIRPIDFPPDPPVVGYFARMCPAKGLETLIDAFIGLKQRQTCTGLRLHVGGTQTGDDPAYVMKLQNRLSARGLLSDTTFSPNLDRQSKLDFFRGLSVFSVPATYGESFGLYVLEALASGVPVVQPRHAAFPEIIEATEGGLLCEPDDPVSLANGLERLLTHPEEAREMARRGRAAVLEKFSAYRMAEEFVSVIDNLKPVKVDTIPEPIR